MTIDESLPSEPGDGLLARLTRLRILAGDPSYRRIQALTKTAGSKVCHQAL